MTVTARNIVIATGGRPKYPTHVSVYLREFLLFDLDACVFMGERLIKFTPSVLIILGVITSVQ